MRPEWKDRLQHWIATLEKEFYEPLGEVNLEYFTTYEMLDPADAEKHSFTPAPTGMPWGRTWEYGWFRGDIVLDDRAAGKMIVMDIKTGGEATVLVNGQEFGTRRAEWVTVPHHYICDQVLTQNGKPGGKFHLLLEAYGGHEWPNHQYGGVATGPVREGCNDYSVRPESETRQVCGKTTYGIWHEEAYQLWLDVTVLLGALEVVDPDSLRADQIEEALEQFTLAVDFEQPREGRIADYIRVRELLKPAMEATNGTTVPEMWAIGNAHIDLSWLWPYRETQRKVARSFAQQLRLMDMYPDYKFIQSQPQSYQICKEFYPDLYERVKEKIKAGQWIADGSMWVEPDTNMSSGESLIRQVIHGKRFYKEEFGLDTKLLWLPDTFGYTAALPQILKNCGVEYLTTQKIFWTYNGSDKFPYHYFTWQGMDGTEIVSFLHMDYTSRLDPATVHGRWKDRVQKRIDKFMLPFGYGDGGGGPCRDHLEHALREKNLQGIPKVRMEAPDDFFTESLSKGKPEHKYVGELYFQCHRGTYTSVADVKRGNRRSELALREAEVWAVAAADKVAYPLAALDERWKDVLLNQFHDILPGSSIARVYEEASARYAQVKEETSAIVEKSIAALTSGVGKTWFNSLSWDRKKLVKTEDGYGLVTIPAMGWSSEITAYMPEQPVTAAWDGDCIVLSNGCLTMAINQRGEIIRCTDSKGNARISGKANELRMYKDVPRLYDAWDIDSMYEQQPVALSGESHMELVEANPWFATIRIKRKISNSLWVQDITVTADSARIDFATHVDWDEQHRLLKVAFPTGIHADEGLNEMQFGYVKRPTHRSRPYDADRFEVCNHRYTALCEENRGAAVLNDCKYGVSMLGDTIALTLLRASTAPIEHCDRGAHDFTYSYYFWDGSFMESQVVQQGYELNVPVIEAEGMAPTASLMQVDASNIIIETVKAAEDGSGDIILRLYESVNTAANAVLSLGIPASHVAICDMLENEREAVPVIDGKVALTFRGFEIKTIRIKK